VSDVLRFRLGGGDKTEETMPGKKKNHSLPANRVNRNAAKGGSNVGVVKPTWDRGGCGRILRNEGKVTVLGTAYLELFQKNSERDPGSPGGSEKRAQCSE